MVAGDQCHGNTSLLEVLCGIDLSRGEGELKHTSSTRLASCVSLMVKKEYAHIIKATTLGSAVIGGMEHTERIALGQIGQKVREYTAIAAGNGKSIVDRPIELKVFCKQQHKMT